MDQARAKVERANTLLRDGIDPNPKHAEPTPSGHPTGIVRSSTLAAHYLEQHAKAKKKSWKQDQGWITLYLLPAWKDMPVGEIRRRHVAELLNTITHERDAPRSSDVVRSLISHTARRVQAPLNGLARVDGHGAAASRLAVSVARLDRAARRGTPADAVLGPAQRRRPVDQAV